MILSTWCPNLPGAIVTNTHIKLALCAKDVVYHVPRFLIIKSHIPVQRC
jgi:hypothetical protein